MIIIYILSIIYINFGLDYQTKKNTKWIAKTNSELQKYGISKNKHIAVCRWYGLIANTTNKRPKPVNTEPKK